LAHYRQPLFEELCLSINPLFTLISGGNKIADINVIDKSLASKNIDEGGLRWHIIKNVWLFNKKILWQTGILRTCFSNEFDEYIFLGNPYFISTWIGAIILKIRKRPVYFWTHGLLKKDKGLKRLIRRIFYLLPTGFFLYGNHARNLLIQEGYNQEKLHVIYNSLNYSKQISFRESLNDEDIILLRSRFFKRPELPQIIFIGRLTKQKKLIQLIEAISILNHKGVLINLLIVGDGSEFKNLKEKVTKKELKDFVFFHEESYAEEDNFKLIVSSDICVAPGEVGLTAMHSLVFGTPVITHNNPNRQMPEFEAIVPGVSGDFFEFNDVIDLALKIESWLLNRPEKKTIRQNCYSIIDSKYNPKYQKDVICNVLLK
jgi:glycosyltransferase involved in cell wall biosynthesis